MNDEKPAGQRPEEGGPLGEEQIVFRYSRERRLERAPESVRRAYAEGYTPNKGFLKGLTANAGLKSILVAIVILSVTVVALTMLGIHDGTAEVGQASAKLRAFAHGESLYLSVQLKPSFKYSAAQAKPSDSPVAALASPVTVVLEAKGDAGQVLSREELTGVFTGAELLLRAVFPDHGATTIFASVRVGDSAAQASVSVDRE